MLHVILEFITGFGKMLWLVAAAVAGGLVAVGWLDARATNPPAIIMMARAMASSSRIVCGVFPMISRFFIEIDTYTAYIICFFQNA